MLPEHLTMTAIIINCCLGPIRETLELWKLSRTTKNPQEQTEFWNAAYFEIFVGELGTLTDFPMKVKT